MSPVSVPTEAVEVYNHAFELSTKGKYKIALNEYKKAIEIYPSFIEAYNNIGEIYSQMGNADLAISTYMDALKIDKNYKILLNLGVEHYNTKKYDLALSFFLESLNQNSNFLEGNLYAGMVHYNLKDYKKAEKFLKKVIKADQKHIKANYLLSYIYYEWKKYNSVIECLDNIKDIADDKSFINKYYGFCYYYLGRYKDAVEFLTTALESNPNYKKFKKYLKGLTYENKLKEVGDIDKEIKELEDKIMIDKPNMQHISRLSMLYIFQGKNKKAEKFLLKVKKKMTS